MDLKRNQRNLPPPVFPEPLSDYANADNDGQHYSGHPEVSERPVILSFYPILDPQNSKSHPTSTVANPVNVRLRPSRTLILGRKHERYLPPQPHKGGYRTVSKRHAIIWIEDGYKVYIKDTKSRNGTYINGIRLSPEGKESEQVELMNDDIIILHVSPKQLGIDIPDNRSSPSKPSSYIRYPKTMTRIRIRFDKGGIEKHSGTVPGAQPQLPEPTQAGHDRSAQRNESDDDDTTYYTDEDGEASFSGTSS